ncbi:MAG: hypothetical protein ACJAYE_000245 [Candidatus Azotimanducaceae bacterium]|jgi:hypothetical protein
MRGFNFVKRQIKLPFTQERCEDVNDFFIEHVHSGLKFIIQSGDYHGPQHLQPPAIVPAHC